MSDHDATLRNLRAMFDLAPRADGPYLQMLAYARVAKAITEVLALRASLLEEQRHALIALREQARTRRDSLARVLAEEIS